MSREQKTEKSDCPCKGMVETESNKGVRSIISLDNANKDGAIALLEKVIERDNLNKAYKRVKANGGSAGIDKMTVEEMLPYLEEHNEELVEAIRQGKYKPKPVRRGDPVPDS